MVGLPGSTPVVWAEDPEPLAATIESFNQNDPMAYEQLAEIVDRVTPEPEGD